jgi:LacI family transcriptional regulator
MGTKPITLQDIAERCGVSKMTVSLALRRDTRISKETTARVQAVAEELGYNAAQQEAARRLALRKHGQDVVNRLVALIFPPHFYRMRYFSDIFRGLLEALTPEGFGLLSTSLLHRDMELPPVYHRGEVDGLVVYASLAGDPAVMKLRECAGFGRRPVVILLGSKPDSLCVESDDRGGAVDTARHLLALGHRHILQFVFPGPEPRLAKRLDGLRATLTEAGLEPERHLHLLKVPSGWMDPERISAFNDDAYWATRDPATDPLVSYLRAHPEVTAVLGINDAVALHAWTVLRRAGYRVPEDISIVGFDDTDPMLDANGRNLLTTVHVPLVEVGQTAARLLVERVTNPDTAASAALLPTHLVERGSTGPVK